MTGRVMRSFGIGMAVAVACHVPTTPTPPTTTPTTLPPAAQVRFPTAPPFRLPHTFEPSSYKVRLAFDTDGFAGEIEIGGELTEPTPILWLHGVSLSVSSAVARRGDKVVSFHVSDLRDDQLVGLLADEPLGPGLWTLSLRYRGLVTDGLHQQYEAAVGLFRRHIDHRDYLFTQFEAIKARRVFPCIDEPDRKVPWQLTLDVADDVDALSNTPMVRQTRLDARHKRVEFAPTPPLPSYLVAFAVGKFDVVDAGTTTGGAPIRIIAIDGHGPRVTWAAAAIRNIAVLVESWLEIPMAYPKLDLVAVPDTGLGGMENPGLITIDQSLFELTDSPFPVEARRDALLGVVAHEIAHLWFGDLVTPRWWDGVWVSEQLATWLASKVDLENNVIKSQDPVDESGRALRQWNRQTRMSIAGTQDLALGALNRAYSYSGVVLPMFEGYLGPDAFRRGLQLFLKEHAHGNASAADLAGAMSRVAGADLDTAFAGTIDNKEPPHIELSLACDRPTPRVDIRWTSEARWTIPLCLAYDRDGKRSELCETLAPTTTSFELPAKRCPKWVLPNRGGVSLVNVDVTLDVVTALAGVGWPQLSAPERRWVFTRYISDESKLDLIPRLVDSSDRWSRILAATSLLSIRERIPARLRSKLDGWVLDRYGGDLERVSLATDTDQLPVAKLLAVAGAPTLAAEAVRVSRDDSAPTHDDSNIVRVAADHEPVVFAGLLTTLHSNNPRKRAAAFDVLVETEQIVHLLVNQPGLLADWSLPARSQLVMARCDEITASDLVALGRDLTGDERTQLATGLRHCLDLRARLEPAIRRLVATKRKP